MKYIDKYPTTKIGDSIDYHGDIVDSSQSLVVSKTIHKCTICHKETRFVDYCFHLPVCSDECQRELNYRMCPVG
jgi:hypothetical protein